MKVQSVVRILGVLVLGLMMFLGTNAKANNLTDTQVVLNVLKGSKAIAVSMVNIPTTRFVVSISNAEGEVILNQVVKKHDAAYTNKYDLSKLGNGLYTFRVQQAEKTYTSVVNVSADGLSVSETSVKEAFKPYVMTYNNKVMVYFQNQSKQNHSFKIYDNDGVLIYENNLGADLEILKKYNLSKLSNGTYNVVISAEDETYEQAIIVR